MSGVVLVPIRHGELTDRMTTMRNWLDHKHCQPISFRYVPDDAGGEFRVEFASQDEAAVFASSFGGRMLELMAAGGVLP